MRTTISLDEDISESARCCFFFFCLHHIQLKLYQGWCNQIEVAMCASVEKGDEAYLYLPEAH